MDQNLTNKLIAAQKQIQDVIKILDNKVQSSGGEIKRATMQNLQLAKNMHRALAKIAYDNMRGKI